VSVNYHTLADFRVANEPVLDRLLTQSVAALTAEGLVTLQRVAQDGVRVRAAAGRRSYRKADRLASLLNAAQAHVEALRTQLAADPASYSRREAAAKERAATQRAERVRRALAKLPALDAQKARPTYHGSKEPPAVSTTDPEARFMRMPDGGIRPAFNAQFATDTASQIIVGLDVVPIADQDQLGPMSDQLVIRYGTRPAEHLVDGGYVNLPQLERLDGCGTTVYMPVPTPRKGIRRDPHAPRRHDSPAVADWRKRMGMPESQTIYRERAASAECVNALARNRGLQAFRVRGLLKARAVLLWFALAHNLLRSISLRTAASTGTI
jgi:hypothetical protein